MFPHYITCGPPPPQREREKKFFFREILIIIFIYLIEVCRHNEIFERIT
jgi:hypothetical protein